MPPFFCYNHQGKATGYIDALAARDWQLVRRIDKALFILSDIDAYSRTKTLAEHHRRGVPIFLYPHAATPNLWWDFPSQSFSKVVTAHFVPAQGHIDIMRAYGVPYKLHAVGFHLCPILPFRPRKKVRNVLFAPIHPNSNGFLGKVDKDINIQVFDKLLPLVKDGSISLTIRYLDKLEQNGLRQVEGVEYIQGERNLGYAEIDAADLVISTCTHAYLAIARGVPTLMIAEWTPTHIGGSEAALEYIASWDKYKDIMMYPLDFLTDEPADVLFKHAIESDRCIAEWRSRMIGKPFEANHFVDVVESYL